MSIKEPDGEVTLLGALTQLRVVPPPNFTESILARVGITVESDQYVLVDGPTGTLFVAFNSKGINHLSLADAAQDRGQFVEKHRERFGRPVILTTSAPAGLVPALRHGNGKTLTYDLGGLSDFERDVLKKALEIPKGEIRPYGWIAREIGRPKAVRAVGSALGRNPIPILIPCHRVVRSDGQIGNYAFGSEMKRTLLDREQVDLVGVKRLATLGVRFIASDTTRVFCYPTCSNARRITEDHSVSLRSAAEAVNAGFRPCKKCRPAEALSLFQGL